MKKNVKFSKQKISPVIAIVTVLLIMAAVFTVSQVFSKYRALVVDAPTARVAKFGPVWTAIGAMDGAGHETVGPGGRDSGLVIHPGNWTNTHNITWRLTNNSEVAVTGSTLLKHAVGPAGTNIGYYTNPASRENLVSACITSGAFGGGGTVSGAPGILNLASNGAPGDFNYTLTPYNSAPSSPVTPISGFPVSNKNYIVYTTLTVIEGGGSSTPATQTIANMDTTWWRTYRLNSDGNVTQID